MHVQNGFTEELREAEIPGALMPAHSRIAFSRISSGDLEAGLYIRLGSPSLQKKAGFLATQQYCNGLQSGCRKFFEVH